ncbi:bifunctional dTDP-4-dehydrorhamnose 3,5-epimerase family protein/NAD(P)-dependent oxidoreductase [Corynebacterium cystitidis]|uniref:bifunctional dTDP-4-dehydrorhamnose 3,5-epimerase family protein/NAD(P)-dependent oxidoreductase n=1 Tax=Corynebacterium cystitidis TaxID=35757 RepID=UPI00211E4AEC|nr:bifunctional dTDP-4-dehydrorhamnose 3,5-epimerase family protein/NAD(P)-dependent oxidoreductase [Corynebacterium cystitidis]
MQVSSTAIDGLLVVELDVHSDARGWFKENWQREKMVAAGLPDFSPVQNNISFNTSRGTTRGLHAEPWDKYVSVATGAVFGAWVDLREGSATFGKQVTCEITPGVAVFVPRGVANGFQSLVDDTAYVYLVNAHWSPDAQYSFVNLDEVQWPLEPTAVSEKDLAHPSLANATAVPPRQVLVTGAHGQLGRALKVIAPEWEYCSREEFDITAPRAQLQRSRDWSQYSAIINTAAYNDVNGAETDRATAWAVNADAPARLATIATEHNLTFVHVSSDYIFDGTHEIHTEDEVPSPLSLYGASKAAGESSARTAPKHYVIRTSWVFGEGKNFMRTMADLARRGVEPRVIYDQRGRPTSAEDLARGIKHLLDVGAEYGVYNVSSVGDVVGRDEIAMAVFIGLGHDPASVHPVSTEEYAQLVDPEATRPKNSTFDLSKIEATGFRPSNWRAALALYLATL